jgi:predicted DNA-binding transcriptional regulator YafY
MNRKDRQTLQNAIQDQRTATIKYYAPQRGGIVTRHVRAYELSANRTGRPVLWGIDSVHGARRIHSFRQDRIVSVKAGQTEFERARSITKHLK